MKRLERGTLMNIQGNDYWYLPFILFIRDECEIFRVVTSLGCVTTDLPQGNNLVGVKWHGVERGCRTCLVTKENATINNLDIASISCYHHIANTQFDDIFAVSTVTWRNEIAKEYGLQKFFLILDQL
ncbi:hypothetical protein F8M41_023875 [Gigaspora margarita]|uniref:Uncharacterized protein n=1 Tax=Gigaspora margarita TaxID=4874 RepID=A0A8H4ACM9_GIGMA|nr:hypothetical protein F8M41_023875 [Gigaspora margarita]